MLGHSGTFSGRRQPSISKTLINLEAWHIPNRVMLTTLIFSEPWRVQNPAIFRTIDKGTESIKIYEKQPQICILPSQNPLNRFSFQTILF